MRSSLTVVTGIHNQKDGLLPKPAKYAHAFPDLLTFQNAATKIAQTLFVMFLEHRIRTFQGTVHASPDYALCYGWSARNVTLTEIKQMAATFVLVVHLPPWPWHPSRRQLRDQNSRSAGLGGLWQFGILL